MKKPTRNELRLAAHALRWAGFGYRRLDQQMAVGKVRRWLLEQAGPLQAFPHVLGEDLELYAINTGSLYHTHMLMAQARRPLSHWRAWVRQHVLYLYVCEVRQVWAMPVEIHRAARALRRYYTQRSIEIGAYGKKGSSK